MSALRQFTLVSAPIVALGAAVLFPFDVAAGSLVGSVAAAGSVVCSAFAFRTARRLPR